MPNNAYTKLLNLKLFCNSLALIFVVVKASARLRIDGKGQNVNVGGRLELSTETYLCGKSCLKYSAKN